MTDGADPRERISRLATRPCYADYLAVSDAVEADPEARDEIRVAFLRNFTIEPILPVIAGECALSGLRARFFLSDHDTIAQAALDENGPWHAFDPHVIVVAQWLDQLAPALMSGSSLNSASTVGQFEHALSQTRTVLAALRRKTSVPILVNDFPIPPSPALGIRDAQSESHQVHQVLRLNHEFLGLAAEHPDVYILGLMTVFARIGFDSAVDRRMWRLAKAPFSPRAVVPAGIEVAKYLRALSGKARKCLVVDCDNTLWGGIVGEDGIDGIQLGPELPGAYFLDFQREILILHERGVILAICSRNNADDVLDVLDRHPEMLLKREHFAAYQINWDQKAVNLDRIAAELQIGIDSLVYVDDSQFECDLIRRDQPEVAVVHLSGRPAEYAGLLTERGFFDTLTSSVEDRARGKMYQDHKKRQEIRHASGTLQEYLEGLGLVATVRSAALQDAPRIAQLCQRTNQFNLTTRRHPTGAIEGFLQSREHVVLTMKLRDKIADLGLVGVGILEFRGDIATIDTLLLSCRALGRGSEKLLLSSLIRAAADRGCARVVGRYLRTRKNGQAEAFFGDCGFQLVVENTEESEWDFQIGAYVFEPPAWISLETED